MKEIKMVGDVTGIFYDKNEVDALIDSMKCCQNCQQGRFSGEGCSLSYHDEVNCLKNNHEKWILKNL